MDDYYLENPWLAAESIKKIEDDMLMPIIISKWGGTELIRKLRKSNGGYIFKLVVVPEGGNLRFYLESGSTVFIFIRGLSFFGGDGIFTSKDFWEQMKNILYNVPKLHRVTDLIPHKMHTGVGRKLLVTKENPFPQLLPINEVQVTNITMEVTAVHTPTGALVKFHLPLDYIPNTEVEQNARIKLSMLVNEWDHTILK